MRWDWLMRWLSRRTPNGVKEYREFVEHRRDVVRKMTPAFEKLAGHLDELPPEELATRLRNAMIRRTG